MNKKIISKLFIIGCMSILSIGQLISLEEDKVPLLRSELRKRKFSQIENSAENSNVNLQKTSIQEQEVESHDEIFSSLGKGWDFFKQGDYKKAYNYIRLSSQAKNYAARYLLARYYEFGLVEKIDSIIACKLYSSVFAESNNPFLKSESEKGLTRMIALTRSKF